MPRLNCEKTELCAAKKVEDKLCQSRNVKSRKVQVKICPTKVGEAQFWSRLSKVFLWLKVVYDSEVRATITYSFVSYQGRHDRQGRQGLILAIILGFNNKKKLVKFFCVEYWTLPGSNLPWRPSFHSES
jgi:hypothetical protein